MDEDPGHEIGTMVLWTLVLLVCTAGWIAWDWRHLPEEPYPKALNDAPTSAPP